MSNYDLYESKNGGIVKAWTRGVAFDENTRDQALALASMPFIHKWVSLMPDTHLGNGCAIGSVIPTLNAIIPAAVGVDIGCGMMAVKTSLRDHQLPDSLAALRIEVERTVPHGSGSAGMWSELPKNISDGWASLDARFKILCDKHPDLKNTNNMNHLGTLGGGNHFLEVCIDQEGFVWAMVHSGSRGVGNRIGTIFIEKARKDMERWMISLPNADLAYIPEGSEHFQDYLEAVSWAQDFARISRELMMSRLLDALRLFVTVPFEARVEAVNCHHNYVNREHHYGKNVWITRKGAVSAYKGEMGIIPGSMGAKSFIVRGLGNPESFCSCSHGAGRVMSRTEAKRVVSLKDHELATRGVECRKDDGVLDETPSAYKPIEEVMKAQEDLVEIVYTIKQVLCVKG